MSSPIPIFALPCVVFPDERIPFHIFEPRYKAMLKDCLDASGEVGEHEFGITYATEDSRHLIGCAVVIERVLERYDDGRTDILSRGTRRYQIEELITGKPYPRAVVTFFDDDEVPPNTGLAGIASSLHTKLVELTTGKIEVPLYEQFEKVSFKLAHNAGLDLPERQRLLEMTKESERLKYLVEHYRAAIQRAIEDSKLKELIELNGHLRKIASIRI